MQQQGHRASQCCRNLTYRRMCPIIDYIRMRPLEGYNSRSKKQTCKMQRDCTINPRPLPLPIIYVWCKCVRIYHSVPHIRPPFCNLILDSLVSTVKCSSEHQLLTRGWLGLCLETNLEGKKLFCHPDVCPIRGN